MTGKEKTRRLKFKMWRNFYKDPFFWVVIVVFLLTMYVFTYGA